MGGSTADRNARIVREYLAGVAEDKYREDLVSDDFVAHVPATLGGDGYTFPERTAVYAVYHEAFPDLDIDVEELIATDTRVVVRLRLTGTHDGVAFGVDGRMEGQLEPTGKEIDLAAAGIFTVEDGSITGGRWFVDKLQLLAQLDALPRGSEAGDQ